MTQREAAARFGVHEKKYWKIEAGILLAEPAPPQLKWSMGDLCALARRRHGKSFRKTAQEIGISHVTLAAWEAKGDDRLVRHWKAMGYLFKGNTGWYRSGKTPDSSAPLRFKEPDGNQLTG